MKLKNLSIDQGQRRVRSSLCCNWSSCHFWWGVVFFRPLVQWWYYPWSSQSFPSERTAGVSSRSITVTNKSNSLTYTVASSFVSTSLLVVTTVVKFLEIFTVSNSAEFRSFLLTVCMLAPESTKNSVSCGFVVDAARKTHSSEGESNEVVSVSLNLWIFLASFPASPRAHRSCLSVSSWDRSSNFTA